MTWFQILGDIINERYTVIRRLGSGAFATVWEVHDYHRPGQSFAMKFTQANYTRMATDEIAMLPRMKHPNVIYLDDHFTIEGPMGTHVVLVYPFLGRDVRPEASDSKSGIEVSWED
jgi:serine/threonine-protein kinase SRPK3